MGPTHTHYMLQHGPILRELLQDEGPRFHRETKHSDPVVVKVINAGEGLSTGGTMVHTVSRSALRWLAHHIQTVLRHYLPLCIEWVHLGGGGWGPLDRRWCYAPAVWQHGGDGSALGPALRRCDNYSRAGTTSMDAAEVQL